MAASAAPVVSGAAARSPGRSPRARDRRSAAMRRSRAAPPSRERRRSLPLPVGNSTQRYVSRLPATITTSDVDRHDRRAEIAAGELHSTADQRVVDEHDHATDGRDRQVGQHRAKDRRRRIARLADADVEPRALRRGRALRIELRRSRVLRRGEDDETRAGAAATRACGPRAGRRCRRSDRALRRCSRHRRCSAAAARRRAGRGSRRSAPTARAPPRRPASSRSRRPRWRWDRRRASRARRRRSPRGAAGGRWQSPPSARRARAGRRTSRASPRSAPGRAPSAGAVGPRRSCACGDALVPTPLPVRSRGRPVPSGPRSQRSAGDRHERRARLGGTDRHRRRRCRPASSSQGPVRGPVAGSACVDPGRSGRRARSRSGRPSRPATARGRSRHGRRASGRSRSDRAEQRREHAACLLRSRCARSSRRSTPARPVRRSQSSASAIARAVSAGKWPSAHHVQLDPGRGRRQGLAQRRDARGVVRAWLHRASRRSLPRRGRDAVPAAGLELVVERRDRREPVDLGGRLSSRMRTIRGKRSA